MDLIIKKLRLPRDQRNAQENYRILPTEYACDQVEGEDQPIHMPLAALLL